MNSINFSIVFLCVIGVALARGGSGEHSGLGGGSGEHDSCLVVDSSVTSCTGATGNDCSDTAFLNSQLKAGTTRVLVCSGRSTIPRTTTIEVKLLVKSCSRCTCFTASSTETRTCAQLQADTTFVKKSCKDQASLISYLPVGDGTAQVCMFNRYGSLIQKLSNVPIAASVDGDHH